MKGWELTGTRENETFHLEIQTFIILFVVLMRTKLLLGWFFFPQGGKKIPKFLLS